jgi:signal transduction histidine kinase
VQERSVIERIHVLEQKVAALEELPARMDRVELQILQFREEVRAEFSTVRNEMRGMGQELIAVIHETNEQTRSELRREMQELSTDLRHDMQDLSTDLRREMRVLYEDLKSTIRTLGEGRR